MIEEMPGPVTPALAPKLAPKLVPLPRPTTVAAALAWARGCLPEGEALPLLAACLQRPPGWLFAHGELPLAADEHARVQAWAARRVAGEPFAYISGRRGFWTLDLEVNAAVLIPREDTETLVQAALARLPAHAASALADLGTGSGAIALALAAERPTARVLATDASVAALDVARANALRLGLAVEFRAGDWCAALGVERFDLIASNPPYLATDDPHQQQGDLRFEPVSALVSGADGLDALRALCRCAPAHLVAGGWLLLEHGWQQGVAVRGLLRDAGLREVQTLRDAGDRERVSLGRRE